ncbi:MAG TPA: SIR2 family protein [Armatimonadota bacterium]|jgi:hypothetical protein
MVDPVVSLAFAMHSRKGAYAVLLGSGVSSSAGVLTGWGITLDLVKKVAKLQGADADSDPVKWYGDVYGGEPDYDVLLAELAKTPPDRQALLKPYFEPSDEDREHGAKLPTAAHRAIAQLVRHGYVRVIITTNFDRLMEEALEDIGVVPEVISTVDQLKGATPLSHVQCLVLKVHGDYRDTRILNTPTELAKYTPRMNRLLDRVFDEFGLIVCGWSAKYDPALRAAIQRCPSRRYTMYWADRQGLADVAKEVAEGRGAEVVRIRDADWFFTTLASKVEALDSIVARHPLSPAIARAEVKRYLSEERYRIQLADLVHDETEQLYRAVFDEAAFPPQGPFEPTDIADRFARYDSAVANLMSIFTTGCQWSTSNSDHLWPNALQRLGSLPLPSGPYTNALDGMRYYPALALMYAGGIAALASGNYRTLVYLLEGTTVRPPYQAESVLFVTQIVPSSVLDSSIAGPALGMPSHKLPVNAHLAEFVRQYVLEAVPDQLRYLSHFDRFEYLYGLVHSGRKDRSNWGPPGLYAYRDYGTGLNELLTRIEREVARDREAWPLLAKGLFGGSLEQLQAAQNAFHQLLRENCR